MSAQLIKPTKAERLEIRCNVSDAVVANLAVHIVFFFKRQLDTAALTHAFAQALDNIPVFAGRMALVGGRMRIRCQGQGVPFTVVTSGRTLRQAIHSVSQDRGRWLVDPVDGATARWGIGPLSTVRVTHLADDATAIGLSWHHAIGDMQTFMHFMNAWAAAAAGEPLAEPLIVEDRAGYLDEQLGADSASEPGVRCMSLLETVRSAVYIAKDSRKQRTVHLHFGDDEITRMRDAYGSRKHLSTNDVVCAHVSEALMKADPAVDRRTLAIAVNVRNRCGIDPMLIGNILTTLNLDLQRDEAADSIAERLRHKVDHFADEHCDLRINQQFLDTAGAWRGARCVSTAFNPTQWNPFISNWSGFGVYRIQFEDTFTSYCTPVMKAPVAGLGVLVEGYAGNGLDLQMSLPPSTFNALSKPAIRENLNRFRRVHDQLQ